MQAVIQRVKKASVLINTDDTSSNELFSEIGQGILVLLGWKKKILKAGVISSK